MKAITKTLAGLALISLSGLAMAQTSTLTSIEAGPIIHRSIIHTGKPGILPVQTRLSMGYGNGNHCNPQITVAVGTIDMRDGFVLSVGNQFEPSELKYSCVKLSYQDQQGRKAVDNFALKKLHGKVVGSQPAEREVRLK